MGDKYIKDIIQALCKGIPKIKVRGILKNTKFKTKKIYKGGENDGS